MADKIHKTRISVVSLNALAKSQASMKIKPIFADTKHHMEDCIPDEMDILAK